MSQDNIAGSYASDKASKAISIIAEQTAVGFEALREMQAKGLSDLRTEIFGRISEAGKELEALNALWQQYDAEKRAWNIERLGLIEQIEALERDLGHHVP